MNETYHFDRGKNMQVLDNIANFHFPGVNELLMSTLALFQLGNKMGNMAPRQYDDIWLYI